MRARTTTAAAAALGLVLLATPIGSAETTSPAPATPSALDLGGTPIAASTDAAEPAELTAGVSADVLGPSGRADAEHFYRYARTMQGSTVHLGVVAAPAASGSALLELEVRTPDGDTCETATVSGATLVPRQPFGTEASIGAVTDLDDVCLTAPELDLRLTSGSGEDDLPVAITVVEEAPVAGAAPEETPGQDPTPQLVAPRSGDLDGAGEVRGSTSFADAPRLEPGTAYTETLAEGDVRLYRVAVGWGQQLGVRTEAPTWDDAARAVENLFTGPYVAVTMLDPLRRPVDDVFDDSVTYGEYAEDEPLRLVDGLEPVAFANRYDGSVPWLAGEFWIAVAVSGPPEDRPPLTVPVTIGVEVSGAAQDPPSHAPTVQGPGAVAGPDGYAPETPYLVGPDEFAGTPTAATIPPRPGDSGDAAELGAVRIAVAVVLGLAGIGLLVGGSLRLRRARRV